MKIEIKKPKMEDTEKQGVSTWPIWEKIEIQVSIGNRLPTHIGRPFDAC
jgi:hypothetical protein